MDYLLNDKYFEVLTYTFGTKVKKELPTEKNINKINISALVGFAFDIKLATYTKLRFEPFVRQSLISIYNTPIKTYLNAAGINVGVQFGL